MDYKYTSRCEEDTLELAENLESEKFPGMVICLDGELGSGKTVFVKGFAKSLGITENITSPTFNILKCYFNGRLPLYHIDAYRLEGLDQDLGFEEMLDGDGVAIVEWGEFIEDILPKERLDITIYAGNDEERTFEIKATGKRYEELMEKLV